MKKIAATWNRAALAVRLNIEPATSTSRWGLSLEEAEQVIRTLSAAVNTGRAHLAEIREERQAS